MLKIGLTGGIGAGKSVVAKVFKVLQVPVFDADLVAKQLVNESDSLKSSIKKEFGEEAYTPEGRLNRDYIATTVFNDPQRLKNLNSIIHPEVRNSFEDWCSKKRDHAYVINEAALLFESGSYKSLDATILVTASEQLRVKRVLKRDPFRSKEEVFNIINRQMSEEEKISLANYRIINDDNALIMPQILDIHKKIIALM